MIVTNPSQPISAPAATPLTSESKRHTRLHELDGLRGILAVYVAFYHIAEGLFNKYGISNTPVIFGNGWYAVDVFFILSGFVMTHVYDDVIRKDGVGGVYYRFMAARVARLYPVHIFTALVMLVCLLPSVWGTDRWLDPSGRYSWVAFVASLVMLQGVWIDHRTWNYPSWSISAEFHVYLVAPFLIRYVATMKSALASLVVCLLVTFLLYVIVYPTHDYPTNGPVILLRALPLFVVGIAIYRLRSVSWLNSNALALAAFAGTLAILSIAPLTPLAVLLAPLVVICTHLNPIARRALGAAPLRFLGDISYSLYMVHALVQIIILNRIAERLPLSLVQQPLVATGLAVCGVLMSIVAAVFVRRFVEEAARPAVYAALVKLQPYFSFGRARAASQGRTG